MKILNAILFVLIKKFHAEVRHAGMLAKFVHKVLLILLFIPFAVQPVLSATYYSISDGIWSASIWSTNPNAATGVTLPGAMSGGTINNGNNIVIRHEITKSDDLRINNGGDIIVANGGTFDLDDLTVSNGGTVSVSSGGSLSATTITANGTINNSGSIDTPSLTINNNGTINNNPGGTISADNISTSGSGTLNNSGSVVTTDCTSIGGSCSSTLPVVLVYFKASLQGESAVLSWQTLTELNNDYFTVERSGDGLEFEAIGRIQGSGSTKEARNYSFTDEWPLAGRSYYRLRQTDFDGTTEIFPAVMLSRTQAASEAMLYPNPVGEDAPRLVLSGLSEREALRLSLCDLNGRMIWQGSLQPQSGGQIDQRIEELAALRPGAYLLNATQSGRQFVQKFFKR